ncbi:MAG: HD domain-containing protein [bacterium]|nr:HD domain-containing protein [bacterium]
MSEIRDTIFGFIEPTRDELKILDTPLLQRLRRIRQLALAYLVYPGALHTRFEHSLGVCYLASVMVDKLLPKGDNGNKEIVKLAALLHDVGHGPFSHVSESILEMFLEKDPPPGEITEKIHEKITARLLKQDKDLKRIIGEDKIDEIIGILPPGDRVDISLMKQIVSGPIDADKQDYLLRDSYFCGVKYGVYDYLRLINTLGSYRDEGDEYICVEGDGIHALEQFILAKYYMTRQVYRHRIRLISDEMIIRGIELGIRRDEIKELKDLYIFKESDTYLANYLKWWDDRLFNFLVFDRNNGYAHDIFERLYHRRLFKKVFAINLKEDGDIPGTARTLLMRITKRENKDKREELENAISKVLTVSPEFTIINSYQVKSVKEVSRNEEKEGQIKINEGGVPKKFEDISTVFQSIDESLNEIWVEVYAPVDFKDRRDREKKMKVWKSEIANILKEVRAL